MTRKDSDDTDSGNVVPITGSAGPARGYTWPPFEANNTAAVKHGAHSKRLITPIAAATANTLMETYPRLRGFREAVLEYARVDAQVERMQAWVDEHGEIDTETGEPTGTQRELLRTRKHLMNLADRLGLTPLANARLGKDTAAAQVDLVKIWEQQQKENADAGNHGA